MTSKLPVIFYQYSASPFAMKIDHVLFMKGIPHQKVKVAPILPRPEITDLLGVKYRRIPVLAIGNDVYCDTSLISAVLERRFPESAGHKTIYPKRKGSDKSDAGLMKSFARHYGDTVLFPLATGMLQWEKFPEPFLKDRGNFGGSPINIEARVKERSKLTASISSHLTLLEEQLADGREWVFDTETPSYGDLSLFFVYGWAQNFPTTKGLITTEKFPATVKWLDRMRSGLFDGRKPKSAPTQLISGDEAAKLISSSSHEPDDVVGFDEAEASRLGLTRNSVVTVTPEDNAKNYPTEGKLVAFSRSEIVLEVKGTVATIRCHFPRIGFNIRTEKPKNKL